MAKKRGVKKKPSKKSVKKRTIKFRPRIDSFIFKREKILVNLLKFLAFFVVCLVLYFVTNNYLLWILFGIGAIIGGAVSFALILMWIALAISKRNANKRK
ncbi:MAG: hypothetical protein WC812_00955 [Candidatus Pacearchaeota archaeon]|jgi:hypothetical protein